jgi:hypothetical protein
MDAFFMVNVLALSGFPLQAARQVKCFFEQQDENGILYSIM